MLEILELQPVGLKRLEGVPVNLKLEAPQCAQL